MYADFYNYLPNISNYHQGQATNVLYLGGVVFVQDKNDTMTLIRLSIVKLLHLCTVIA